MRSLFQLAILLLSLAKLNAASFYIDNTASGSNNGTSWANAWQTFAAINWASISAGDTIFISGGASFQTYGETFTFSKSGTAGNLITLRIGQDVGHTGVAIINGNYVDMRPNYTSLDGNFGGANHIAIQNFITSDITRPELGKAIYADGSVGNVVSYVGITNCSNGYGNIGGHHWLVSHCALDEIRGDAAIRTGSTPDAGYDDNIVEYCDIRLSRNDGSGPPLNGSPMLGPDGIQGGYSITVRYSRFRILTVSYNTSYQHPDYTQLIGNHTRIHGNEFWNIGDSANDFDCWINPTMSHVQIYNNIYRITQDIDPYPEYIRVYSGSATMTALDDWLIANNTFIDNSWNNIRLIWKGTPAITNWRIENNIYVNSSPYEVANNLSGTIAFANNVYYPSSVGISYLCAPAGGNTACNNYTATSWSAVEPTRIVGLPTFASYTYRSTANDFHLAAGDTVARGAGVNLSAYFTVDKDAITRAVPFACGAYQGGGSSPGSIGLDASAYSVTEGAGTVVVTLRRTLGSSGAVGVSYATADGTALDGVNYTGVSGTKSWADTDTADKTVSITIANTGFTGQKQFTFGIGSVTGGATLASVTNAPVAITGSGSFTPLAGLSWRATSGQISSPFVATGTNYISQGSQTTDPSVAGRATYTFTNTIGTNVVVDIYVNAPGDANNSIFANFTTDPTAPTMISDIYPFTSGFETRTLNWRGSGAFDNNEFVPNTFNVSTGLVTLILLGREADVQIAQVTVRAPTTNSPPTKPTNVTPAPSSTNIAPLLSLYSSPYSSPSGFSHAHSQFQIYAASQTTLLWDTGLNGTNGALGAVTNVVAPRLDLGFVYYWTCRHEDTTGAWSDWSDLTPFQIRFGKIANGRQANAGQVQVHN